MSQVYTNTTPKKMTDAEMWAAEIYKCRMSPFYFIYNYVHIPITGGGIKLTEDNLHPKMKRVVRLLYKYHRCVLMASRQLGKSTIAACMIAWSQVFFPRNKAIILNMKKTAALQNIQTIKYIIEALPNWMVTNKPFKSRSDIKSYLELFNNSKVEAFYPATTHAPETLARSLTSPILYIDEGAFINYMDAIYGLSFN